MKTSLIENTNLYLLTIIAYIAFGIIGIVWFAINWWAVLFFWLFFAFGNGTVGHRYFAHNSFTTSKAVHWALGLWVTLCAYSPVHYWVVQHKHHHRHTDTQEDLHSPKNGLLNAFVLWPLNKSRIEAVLKDRSSVVSLVRALRDPSIVFYSQWFVVINAVALAVLAVIDWNLIFAGLGVAYIIEQVRLGVVNTVTHISGLPGNYTTHEHNGSDQSQNNWVLGLITLGFAWHNNHHANPKKLILTERWWEIDLEGYLGWLLGRTGETHDKNTTIRH
jgi:stearoyl-CoA desaturase (delta-9 desaturase)